ncbi:MAG: ABC transporter permease [Candidatus Izemoplasmatales bacterium]
MNRLLYLIKGELLRLHKYNVISISVLVAFIWGIGLYFLDNEIFDAILPMIVLVDTTMMSVMYIGSVMFFEKKESTLSTILVTPVKNTEIINSKIIANTIHNVFSTLLIVIVFIFIRSIEVNIFLILIAIILNTVLFTALGLYIAYFQKDFTTMLVTVMMLMFLTLIPTVLYELNVLKSNLWEYILLINPVQAAQELVNGAFKINPIEWKYYFSLVYSIGLFVVSYLWLIVPKFKKYAVSASGV